MADKPALNLLTALFMGTLQAEQGSFVALCGAKIKTQA